MMTQDEMRTERAQMLIMLRELNHNLEATRKAHEKAYTTYHALEVQFKKLDRELAELHVTKVPARKSGIQRKEKDPSAFLDSLTQEQKKTLLVELGLTS